MTVKQPYYDENTDIGDKTIHPYFKCPNSNKNITRTHTHTLANKQTKDITMLLNSQNDRNCVINNSNSSELHESPLSEVTIFTDNALLSATNCATANSRFSLSSIGIFKYSVPPNNLNIICPTL